MREYLKSIRESQGLTQEQLANQLGINANYYCMIENGNRQKNMELLMANRLSKALHVSVYVIIAEESKLARESA